MTSDIREYVKLSFVAVAVIVLYFSFFTLLWSEITCPIYIAFVVQKNFFLLLL